MVEMPWRVAQPAINPSTMRRRSPRVAGFFLSISTKIGQTSISVSEISFDVRMPARQRDRNTKYGVKMVT
jgi:hypothetical protein